MNTLSIVVPCYNEEGTIQECVDSVLAISDPSLNLEVIIVDDCSKDNSLEIARAIARAHPQVRVISHDVNQGKGAALRTGFRQATGDFVAVQDADLEYDPMDLKRLIVPLIKDEADVVLGSRFLSAGAHRVLYYWHSFGNKFLTSLSNMFTDLNLTDMETCYKVFKRAVIQSINIEENRFGFEPEIVAKISAMRLRVYEMGISYFGRTYAEGKKIGIKDGFRALYCILRYNACHAPLPIQFFFYLFIGGIAAICNVLFYMVLLRVGLGSVPSVAIAFILAAVLNYILCILLLFRHKARWNSVMEVIIFILVVGFVGVLDIAVTQALIGLALLPIIAKSISCFVGLFFNFLGRRFLVFPEPVPGPWKRSVQTVRD